jgi:hypothetical protein
MDKQQAFPNYFSHVRYEDMADGKTRKILETQSDLMQKENFAREIGDVEYDPIKLRKELEKSKGTRGYKQELVEEQVSHEERMLAKQKEKDILKPYASNDPLAQLRTFREEVKRAAKDGKDTLLIPSGNTAMKIEGLSENDRWTDVTNWNETTKEADVLSGKYDLKEPVVGKIISKTTRDRGVEGGDWVITDVLGDGRFKAVSKRTFDQYLGKDISPTGKLLSSKDVKSIQDVPEVAKETFDISGKSDTNHFVYKLNEEAIPREARKQGLVVEGKVDLDNGTWWKIKIPKEKAKMPVEAFGIAPSFSINKEEE